MASAYEDGNDANTLRFDPMFQMGLGRQPLDEDSALASGATFSRLENAVSAKDIYRMAAGFVEQFIACYAEPPDAIVLDMDPTMASRRFVSTTITTAVTAICRVRLDRVVRWPASHGKEEEIQR